MELHLKLSGIILVALSSIHVIFPRYFSWKQDLSGVSLINRQMMYVHTFFIGLIVLLMGIFCLVSAKDIIHTPLGKLLALGFCIFWSARLFVQFFVYSPQLWRGKRLETTIHVVFSLTWMYLSAVFFWIYWSA